MNRLRIIAIACLVAGLASAPSWLSRAAPPAQAMPSPAGDLAVSGAGVNARVFAPADWKSLPRTTINVANDKGSPNRFEGVRASDILRAAGMKFGHDLRGPRLADCLVAEAKDGYRVVFALPELDSEFSDRVVLVANVCDGKPLSAEDGPLRIVVSDEKRHARWVRGVVSLTVESVGASPR